MLTLRQQKLQEINILRTAAYATWFCSTLLFLFVVSSLLFDYRWKLSHGALIYFVNPITILGYGSLPWAIGMIFLILLRKYYSTERKGEFAFSEKIYFTTIFAINLTLCMSYIFVCELITTMRLQ